MDDGVRAHHVIQSPQVYAAAWLKAKGGKAQKDKAAGCGGTAITRSTPGAEPKAMLLIFFV
jgi:hypothetical protein